MKFYLLLAILISFATSCTSVNLKGEIHNPVTSDNWKLTMEHFPAKEGKTSKKYPVILCHGLIGNRYDFTLNEEKSYVHFLREEGYDVWILDLRGRRDAGTPSLFFGEHTYDFNFDDYASKDVDAAITYVIEKTGKNKVNWIGHSMGGMIMYARMGSMGENRVANLITVGSPFTFFHATKNLKLMQSFSWLTAIVPVVPSASIARIEANTKIPLVPRALFLNLFYYSPNMDPEDELKLKRHGTNNEAPGVMDQFSGSVETGMV
ncbi:MAG: alpha/beta fold hydrolase, partial [Leptospiraceae bacterium]|nr:alpha/beta fold hydrolase [Leptospiraceae bacterium]